MILDIFDNHFDNEKLTEHHKLLIEIAIWFHRIVFIPLDIDLSYSFKESSTYVESFIKNSNFEVISEDDLNLIKCLIMSVHRHNQKSPLKNDSDNYCNQFFLDTILAFFAIEEDKMPFKNDLEDAKNAEQSPTQAISGWQTVSTEYVVKRKIILQRLLKRERIFMTDLYFEKYEAMAKDRLRQEVLSVE